MPLAPVVHAFVQRHRLGNDAVRPDGRVMLNVDDRYRIQLIDTAHQRVALQSELIPLPGGVDRRSDDLLLRLATLAAGMLQRQPSTLCIDPRSQSLVLQQIVASNADVDALEEALGQFTNALSFWHRLLAAETPLQAFRST